MSDHAVTPEGSMTGLWDQMGELREIEARRRAEARLTDALTGGREPIGDPPPDDDEDDEDDDDDE